MIRVAAVLSLGLAATGCQSRHKDVVAFLKAHEHEVSAIEYRVGIPDALQISAPQVLEIDRVTQTVRPDGKIALRLLGPVKVVGMTEREIAARLARQLEPYYENPKVQVRVTSYKSKVIYVSGMVGASANGSSNTVGETWTALAYTGRDTVLDVLAKTGLSFIAWRSQVKVIRSSPEPGEQRELMVDVQHMIATGDTSQNVLLMPNDILVVPPTPLGWLGLRVQEVLFPLQPAANAYQFPAGLMATQDEYDKND
jgi:protein involved in polysaccharide export with SLBB domain